MATLILYTTGKQDTNMLIMKKKKDCFHLPLQRKSKTGK